MRPELYTAWCDYLAKSLPDEFPINNWDNLPNCPRSIPMKLALQHNAQASQNHDMGMHHLYKHGLSPVELYYVLRDEAIPHLERDHVTALHAITYIGIRVEEYEALRA